MNLAADVCFGTLKSVNSRGFRDAVSLALNSCAVHKIRKKWVIRVFIYKNNHFFNDDISNIIENYEFCWKNNFFWTFAFKVLQKSSDTCDHEKVFSGVRLVNKIERRWNSKITIAIDVKNHQRNSNWKVVMWSARFNKCIFAAICVNGENDYEPGAKANAKDSFIKTHDVQLHLIDLVIVLSMKFTF